MSATDWGTTRRVPVQVILADDLRLDGDLHLLERTTYPPGPETPLEMLNRSETFFALTGIGAKPGSGTEHQVALLSKAQVAVVACRDEVAPLDPDRASVATAAKLAVELHGGAEYQGHVTFELPRSHARVLDYVNSPGAFFALWDHDTIRYINKSFVRCIRPLD
jgi:hypothetical protein